MDVLDSSNVININTIQNWHNSANLTDNSTASPSGDSIFKLSQIINEKVAIWYESVIIDLPIFYNRFRTGSIYRLRTDAIVIPINNFVDGKLSIESSAIYKLAGNKYARGFINTVIGSNLPIAMPDDDAY